MKRSHPGTYDNDVAKSATLSKILGLLASLGARRIYVKKLSPNDNSKNQPYFGAHLPDVAFIPSGELVASPSNSLKTKNPKRKIKYYAPLKFSWFDAQGHVYKAPNAKFIYYPQYPEVRFSGFLLGSGVNAGQWMDPNKQGRSEGRWLILGVNPNGSIYGYLAVPSCNISNEISNLDLVGISKIFGEIDNNNFDASRTARSNLITKLQQIHELGWIPSQRLNSSMESLTYKAQNGGGYTLEAKLGISPNGFAEPDYMGWEVKQFGVTRFPLVGAKPTTLMTPEPNGGYYKDSGAEAFVRRYGYKDRSGKPDRLNFGGKHVANKTHSLTDLTLSIEGFSPETNSITFAGGVIALRDSNENIAASWSFAKLMEHWKRKHAQAVYIACIRRLNTGGVEYCFGRNIELGVGTNLEKILGSIQSGNVYYDPGIKLENLSSAKPKLKRRSQFRVAHKNLEILYDKFEFMNLLE